MAPTVTVTDVWTTERDRLQTALDAQTLLIETTTANLADTPGANPGDPPIPGERSKAEALAKEMADLQRQASTLRQRISDPDISEGQRDDLQTDLLANLLAQAKKAEPLADQRDKVATF